MADFREDFWKWFLQMTVFFLSLFITCWMLGALDNRHRKMATRWNRIIVIASFVVFTLGLLLGLVTSFIVMAVEWEFLAVAALMLAVSLSFRWLKKHQGESHLVE